MMYLDKPATPEEALAHFGVKGMKWGVRKKRDNTPNAGYTADQQKRDRKRIGKAAVKRINRRMNAGQTHKQAYRREVARRLVGIGALLGVAIVAENGPQLMSSIAKRAETNRGQGAVKAIASTAVKLNYIKPKRGVYKITTMR